MANRQYQSINELNQPMVSETALPIHLPVAIYYRQSTDAQIGNISTTIQTVDMVKYLKSQGWSDDLIIMIDQDGGVSGAKKIEERQGMRLLFSLITQGKIGAVACEDEDRLFRDQTQIQVNVFVEACRKHNVRVITPSLVYNFADEQQGVFYARQFRFKAEFAADYLNVFVKGKLFRARQSLMMNGQWSGAPMPAGYMTDMRKHLPGGAPNDQYRKYAVFEPYAAVIREYYQIFLAHSGNASGALRHIQQSGPYFPDLAECEPPEGFKVVYRLKPYNGHWTIKAKQSFVRLLTNAAYIGHWVVNNTVIHWNNHPPIIDEATFYRTFNYLSEVALDGSDNPDYRKVSHNTRISKDDGREARRPLLTGLIFAPWEDGFRQVGTKYKVTDGNYFYALIDTDGFGTVIWNKKADFVDASVAALLAEKLRLTFDYDVWYKSIEVSSQKVQEQRQLIEAQIRQVHIVMENLVASLASVSIPQLVAAVEQKYQDAQAELKRLKQELEDTREDAIDVDKIMEIRHAYSHVFDDWENMDADEKREVMHVFVDRVIAQKDGDKIELTIHWKDDSSDEMELIRAASTGTVWLPNEIDVLLELFESGASKVEISRAFPDRTWRVLYCKYTYLTGKSMSRESKNTVRKYETYNEYAERVGLEEQPGGTSEADSTTKSGIVAAPTAANAPAISPK